jgi:hypothetical protein
MSAPRWTSEIPETTEALVEKQSKIYIFVRIGFAVLGVILIILALFLKKKT